MLHLLVGTHGNFSEQRDDPPRGSSDCRELDRLSGATIHYN